jgi:hypothetical protein
VAAKSSIDGQILQQANRWGHVHYLDLQALGLSRSAIAARCAANKLIREHHGVYSVGHSQTTPAARADAAVMACGARAVLSHDSAAALFKLRKWPRVARDQLTAQTRTAADPRAPHDHPHPR